MHRLHRQRRAHRQTVQKVRAALVQEIAQNRRAVDTIGQLRGEIGVLITRIGQLEDRI